MDTNVETTEIVAINDTSATHLSYPYPGHSNGLALGDIDGDTEVELITSTLEAYEVTTGGPVTNWTSGLQGDDGTTPAVCDLNGHSI